MVIKKQKKRPVFLATICARRATDEWQRAQAGVETAPPNEPEQLRRIREYAGLPTVTDEECAALRAVYDAFPPVLMVSPDRRAPGDYEIVGWLPQQDEAMANACWLMEKTLNGWPEDKKAEFTRQWQAKQYTLQAPLTVPGMLLDFHTQVFPARSAGHYEMLCTPPTWPPERKAYDRLRVVALANLQRAQDTKDITGDCDTCPRSSNCRYRLYMCDYDSPLARRYCKRVDCRKKGGSCCKTQNPRLARPSARCMCPALQVAGEFIVRKIMDQAKEEGAQSDTQKSN